MMRMSMYTLENPVTRERADLAVQTVCAYFRRSPVAYTALHPNGEIVEEIGLLARLLAEECGLSERDSAHQIGISRDALRYARGKVEDGLAAGSWMVITAYNDLMQWLARAEARARRRQIAQRDPDGYRRACILAALDRRDAILRPEHRAACRAAAAARTRLRASRPITTPSVVNDGTDEIDPASLPPDIQPDSRSPAWEPP